MRTLSPSVETTPTSSLLVRLEAVTEPRLERHRKHTLIDLLAVAICSILGGANSWLAVVRFGHAHEDWFRGFLELQNGIPSHDTFNRVFSLLKPEELEVCFRGWVGEVGRQLGLNHVAIDGKTMRGSDVPRRGIGALHVVSAFATANGVTLGQTAVDEKSNEITAIPNLLRMLDLKGAIVTIDAMGCQKAIAETIREAEADFVLAVKENQPTLAAEIAAVAEPVLVAEVPPEGVDRAETSELNRGRSEWRRCHVITDLSGLSCRTLWKGLGAIVVVESERCVNGKVERETRYYITSRVMPAGEMLKVIRDHWRIENSLHWVLDVVFGEDHHQLREGYGAHNFTLLSRLALSMIRTAKMKEGIKGAREMAGWDVRYLERLIEKAMNPQEI